MYQLRQYQTEAVEAAVNFFQSDTKENAIEVLPTGSGKSLIIANIALRLGTPVLIFQPSKEILEQNFQKLSSYGLVPCSIYSASCGSKEMNKITFATIGSVIRHTAEFAGYKNVIIDECHNVNADAGMYQTFIRRNGCKVLGLTATPYRLSSTRMGSMLKFITRTREKIFSQMIYAVQVSTLLSQGFLANMNYYSLDMLSVTNLELNSTGNDYTDESVKAEYERSNFSDSLESIVHRLLKVNRRGILVFTRFVEEAWQLCEAIPGCNIVTGETPKAERSKILSEFKAGKTKVLVNVGVLTTGFDYPELDTVVMARPTRSLSMWYQICGRAIRPFPGKISWIVDLCGTYNTFGKVEDLKIALEPGDKKGTRWAVFNAANNKQLTNTFF